MTSISDINFFDPEAFADGRAEEWLTYLRANAPVWRHPDPTGGPGVWMITKHEDVRMISRTPEIFSADRDNGGINGMSLAEMEQLRKAAVGTGKMFIHMDPPEHGPYRKNLSPGFSHRVIDRYAEDIQTITDHVLDRAMEKGHFDFISEIACEIPLNLVADVLGVPEEDRHALFEHVENNKTPPSPELYRDEEFMKTSQDAIKAIRSYGEALLKKRAIEPADDVVTRLALGQVNGEPVPLANNVSNFHMLWGAGAETTRTALAWGMYAFMKHPDQYQLVREDPSLLDGPAVDEILRWASPVHRFRRNVMADFELRGQKLSKGDGVMVWYSSANRDEEVFSDPFTFDVTRTPNPHLAFGGGGPHFCMGNHLAKLELKLVFGEIVRRVPEPKMLTTPERFRNTFFRGISSMQVDFT